MSDEAHGEADGIVAEVVSSFVAGSRIAGYRLEREIGRGGMAVVFRAHDERLDRLVALRILAAALAADEAFRQRFIRESRAAAAVDDPHIIPVFEAGEANGVLFIAMRYVSGGDMRTLLDRDGPMSPGRIAAIISPVASALDAAHAAGLVHRDVKPANMLVDTQRGRPDHVYLSDFGLSKGAASSLTGSGQFLGTLEYIPPEQIEGKPVDGRADEYALACAAFELLTGAPPFQRDEAMAVMYAQLSEPPPLLTSRRQDLPPAADEVFARALAKTPAYRYASCREFADALRSAFGLQPYDSGPGAIPAGAHPPTQIAGPSARDIATGGIAPERIAPDGIAAGGIAAGGIAAAGADAGPISASLATPVSPARARTDGPAPTRADGPARARADATAPAAPACLSPAALASPAPAGTGGPPPAASADPAPGASAGLPPATSAGPALAASAGPAPAGAEGMELAAAVSPTLASADMLTGEGIIPAPPAVPAGPRRPVRLDAGGGAAQSARRAQSDWSYELDRPRRVSPFVLAGVVILAVAGVIAAAIVARSPASPGAAGSAGHRLPVFPITATSSLPPVTGDVWVVYQGANDSSAQLSGAIKGVGSGEVAELYAQQFPYQSPPAPAGSVVLIPAGATATYQFQVTPVVATRYKVELLRSSTAKSPLASSATSTIYVALSGTNGKAQRCSRPVCRQKFRVSVPVPASALMTEVSKRWYSYFAVALARARVPPAPKLLRLGAGHARVSRPRRISATRLGLTVTYSFRIGARAYNWSWNICTKDTEMADGIGLPGHHGCGGKDLPAAPSYAG